MTQAVPQQDHKGQQLPVFRAQDFHVINGANEGDALSFANELMLDDVYELRNGAHPAALAFAPNEDGSFHVADVSSIGRPFATLYLDCSITLMQSSGDTVEALILVEVDAAGHVVETYLHAFAPLDAKAPYTLIGVDRKNAHRRLGLASCVSFTRGTHITMADGAQTPVESLNVGDKVLTRDAGVQEIRWIGRSTVRATGPFAPIVITAGTLNNLGDLVVNPDHRLFVYQREDKVGAGQAEVMVKARYLLNGTSVYVQNGGYIEYFQLLLDDHHIIFAEGIAVETMRITRRNRTLLPSQMSRRWGAAIPGHSDRPHAAFEIAAAPFGGESPARLLRRASRG